MYVPFRCLMVALKIPDLVMGESIKKGCKKEQIRQSLGFCTVDVLSWLV